MKSANPYTAPVNKLLEIGSPHEIKDWSHYLILGITEADIPELARMAIDDSLFDSENEEFLGIIHAWRTLAELQTDQAIEPLIAALLQWAKEDDWWDWESEEMPAAFGRLGTRALPALAEVMANTKHDAYARHDATNSVKEIFERDPDSREACLQILMSQLKQFAKNDPDLNAYLVTTLAADMKALEAADLIEQAYRSGRVNEDFIGDWDDAQVCLGLKEESEIPQRYRNIITNPWEYTPPEPVGFTVTKGKALKTQAKAKRKLQSQSRKKNRTKRK
jgi:hypothetical protein